MKKLIKLIIILLVLVIVVISCLFIHNRIEKDKREKERKLHIQEIKEHFSTYSITNKDAILFKLENDEMVEYGKVSSNVKLVLSEIKDDYYSIKDLDLYINSSDVDKIDEFKYSDRYKKYIPFNTNIKTKEVTNFYDENDNLIYTINNSYDLVVIINDSDIYGVEFNNQLLYVKSEDVVEAYSNHNTDLENKKNIRVITYHHFYNSDTESCDESICFSIKQLEEQFKYLSENNYLTLTMEELELYMDGKLRIPNNSTVLTIDDGTRFYPGATELFEKYDIYATIFLITSWVTPENFNSDHLAYESHTHNMHNQYECPDYGLQGGGLLCLSDEYILNDLKTSQEILGGSKYLAYPFFDWNERAINLLKQAGFHMAFIGAWTTDGVSTPGVTDKFKMRRKTMFSNVDLNEFINEYLN